MVHEQREGRGLAPFGSIIDRVQLALPLYDGEEHRRVCLRVMLRASSTRMSCNRTARLDRVVDTGGGYAAVVGVGAECEGVSVVRCWCGLRVRSPPYTNP